MIGEALTHWLSGNRLARRIGDAWFANYARRRMIELDNQTTAKVQEQTLLRLVQHARGTKFGYDHEFGRIGSLRDYQRLVPLRDYEAFWKEYWQPAYPRLTNASWPGTPPYFALSSGTTSGTTKYIPVSAAMLASNRRAAFTALSACVSSQPDAKLFQGRMFFLGGSTDLTQLDPGVLAGDLSGIATREVPSWLRPYTFPPLDLALLSDWEKKVQVLAEHAARLPITLVSGVPAWLLILFAKLKEVTGKKHIAEIWPTLRIVMHGGTKFDPYRELFHQEIGNPAVRCVDTYACSEGFIAFEDPRYQLLRLLPDHGLFFEFVPVAELELERPTRHPIEQVELGMQYAVVVITCAGLWSYVIGDTVAFERRDPPLLRFTGRTKYYLSAFGEHLISEEVERAITAAAQATHAAVVDFHVGPVFPTPPATLGRHRYLIEFATPPTDLAAFTQVLDQHLSQMNDDYRAHRAGDIGMAPPEATPVTRGAFAAWLRSVGKLGGQHKLPRMDNTGVQTQQMLDWLHANAPRS